MRLFNPQRAWLTRAWRLAAPVALVWACAGAVLAADARGAQFYEDALVRYRKKDFAGAAVQLRNVLQINRQMLPAQLLLGKVLLENGEVAAAEVALNEALKLGVDRAEAVVPLAKSVAAQGRLKEVVDGKRFALDGLPAAPLSQLLLIQAAARSDLNNTSEALQAIASARAIDPKAPESWLAEVPVRIRARQYKQATAAADQALALAPDSADAHYLRGSIAHAQGSAAPALAAYSRAIQLKPDHGEALIARAGLYLDLKRLDDAQADIAAVRKIAPREARAAYLGSLIAERRGDTKAARAALVDITAVLDPVPIEFLHFRHQMLMLGGLAHHGLGENEKARPYLESLVRQQGSNPAAKLLGKIYLSDKYFVGAVPVLEAYVKANPGDTQAVVLLASAHMGNGRSARATQLLRDAAKADDSPRLQAFLGMALMGGGKAIDALPELERAWRKDPTQLTAGAALADLYLRANQPAQAAEVAQALLKRSPKDPQFHHMLGVARAQSGDAVRAMAAYEQALQINPGFLPAMVNLARLDAQAGHFDAANKRLGAVLALNPKHVEAITELGLIADYRGQPADAARYLEKAADYSPPGDLRPLQMLAELYLRSGPEQALADTVKKLMLKAPDNLSVLLIDARARLAAKDAPGAQQTLARASRIAEFDAPQQVRVATLQMQAGDAKGALYSLTKALQGQPDDVPAKALAVEAQLRLGDLAAADATARQVAAQQPKSAIGHMLIGDVATARNQPAAALDAYRRAQQLQPSSAGVQRIHATLSRQNQPDAAAQFAAQWLKSNPRDTLVRRAVADGYARTAKFEAARTSYEALIAVQPDDAEALNNLANVMLQLKDPGALKVAERALALKPNTPYIIGTTGWAAFQAGQGERGLKLLRDARLRDPDNPSTRYFLGAILVNTGRAAEARSELTAALQAGPAFAYAKEAEQLLSTLK